MEKADQKFWRTWYSMVRRCTNPKDARYYYYSKIGISPEWQNSFEQFRTDMLDSYRAHVEKFGLQDTTIDRIDNTAPYSKDNCRWATWAQQRLNKTYGPNPKKVLCGTCKTPVLRKVPRVKHFCSEQCATNYRHLLTTRKERDRRRRYLAALQWARNKRATDPEYAERRRTYIREYQRRRRAASKL